MFQTNADFDFDDDVLSHSFVPVSSSTQSCSDSFQETKNGPVVCDKNEDNTRYCEELKCDNSLNSTRILKRKFPGPAGLLPDKNEAKKKFLEKINHQNITLTQFMSTESSLTFEGVWEETVKNCKTSGGISLTETFNISWIKRQARSNNLTNQKSPFLAAIIQSIEIAESKTPVVNVTLKDDTGQIQGTITYKLYEKYSRFLVTGSVLVLKYLGVLSTGFDSHFVIILPENLCLIYHLKTVRDLKENGGVSQFHAESDVVNKIDVNCVRYDEIWMKYVEEKRDEDKKKIHKGFIRNNSNENIRNKLNIAPVVNSNISNKNVINVQKPDNFKHSIDICKQKNVEKTVTNAQKEQNQEILKNLLDGVNMDELLGDF